MNKKPTKKLFGSMCFGIILPLLYQIRRVYFFNKEPHGLGQLLLDMFIAAIIYIVIDTLVFRFIKPKGNCIHK